MSTYREREVVFPAIELASICCASKGTAFHDKHIYIYIYIFFSYARIIFITVVSDKQLKFAAMASPASRVPTCAARLTVTRAAARAAQGGPGVPA